MFLVILGAILLFVFFVVWFWQSPGLWRKRMTPAEIDQYMAQIDRCWAAPAAEKSEFISRARAWATADDGKPVLLLNLLRYYDQLQPLPGSPEFKGTPQEANAKYEKTVGPLAIKRGEYPRLVGHVQGANLAGYEPELDKWDHVVVMRAPSRRAFIQFMADPNYGPVVYLKYAAAKVLLIPFSAEKELPDLRIAVGCLLLILFLIIAWIRAAVG